MIELMGDADLFYAARARLTAAAVRRALASWSVNGSDTVHEDPPFLPNELAPDVTTQVRALDLERCSQLELA
ncbi:MAG TPA: hypothetical protein VNF47_21710 [Streptosporangiaceae bacterium]|nr:hypothetical protein [Streptosporangiaceae bacterium]